MTDKEMDYMLKEAQVGQAIMDMIERNLNEMKAPLGFRLGLFSSLIFGTFIDLCAEDRERAVFNINKLIGVLQAMREAPDAASMQEVVDATAAVNMGQTKVS